MEIKNILMESEIRILIIKDWGKRGATEVASFCYIKSLLLLCCPSASIQNNTKASPNSQKNIGNCHSYHTNKHNLSQWTPLNCHIKNVLTKLLAHCFVRQYAEQLYI